MNTETQLSEDEIRERIAESGKMRINEVVAYFKGRFPGRFDLKVLKANAKEMINEARKFNR